MAVCEECGRYRYSETRVSGLCRACWATKDNPYRRVPRESKPCVLCKEPTAKWENYSHRQSAWVYEFLGGALCNRCNCSLSGFANRLSREWKGAGRVNRTLGESIILAWMCRLLDHHARHQRKWRGPRLPLSAFHKTDEHKRRLSVSVRVAKNG